MRHLTWVFFLIFTALFGNAGNLYAVGDLHADPVALRRILVGLELLDRNDNWIGGDSQLVTLGDHFDRGPDSRSILDLLIKLEKEARKAGGRVVNLIGNHEYMALFLNF